MIPSKDLEQRDEDLGQEVEYVVQTEIEGMDAPEFSEYAKILKKFNPFQKDEASVEVEEAQEEEQEQEQVVEASVSKKQRKRDKRDKIEVLKLLSDHPEIVEIHDVNSSYPWLLVDLKSYRNSVPVPRHWSQRRKYLQGKRGIEKVQYELPDFIRNTGIADMRQAVLEKEESQKLKSKARDRLQPKMGKIDIDYHVLYDAFFRHQTKPTLTSHGDIYYEGKEFEVNLKERKPGHLSVELRRALGMPEAGVFPPPWLANMQRHGPPPGYPHLRIPGLNAPIPPGAKLGPLPGWGQPPVDNYGRPLYGGDWNQSDTPAKGSEPIEYECWGIVEDQDESDDEYEMAGGEQDMEEDDVDEEQMSVGSGTSSEVQSGVVSGYETPESIDLRKQKLEKERHTDTGAPKQLYQELRQENVSVGNAMFGSQHRYVMPSEERVTMIGGQRQDRMEVTLNPSELMEVDEGITEDLIRKKYDDTLKLEKDAHRKEDMSDLVASESARRKRKEKQKGYRF